MTTMILMLFVDRYIEVDEGEKVCDITQKELSQELDLQNADKVCRDRRHTILRCFC